MNGLERRLDGDAAAWFHRIVGTTPSDVVQQQLEHDRRKGAADRYGPWWGHASA